MGQFNPFENNGYSRRQTDELLSKKADLDENGLIPTSEIPPEAFEYMIDVEDDTARFALTTDDVQKGDIVRVISTGIMYIVVDVTNLDTEAGYKPFAAGIAAKAIGDEDGNNIKQTYQTILTFDGTYDGATNKAATESTVTNAIAALDVTGSSNISPSKTISAWSETDGKVSIDTQDIAIASSQTTAMTNYAKASAKADISTSDTLNQAMGKVEYRVEVNETNISNQQDTIASGGNGYALINGIRLYVSSTAPTGDIPDGSVGVGW